MKFWDSMSSKAQNLRLPARLESIRDVVNIVKRKAEEAQFSEQAIFHCHLAVDEACTNIIEHAYGFDPDGEIELSVTLDDASLTISLTDFGEPYDPIVVESHPQSANIETMRPGGLGLFLMRKVMDEVQYTPGQSGNTLIMTKRLIPDNGIFTS